MNQTEFITEIAIKGRTYQFFDICELERKGVAKISRLPFSIRILVENLLRKMDGYVVREEDVLNIANWQPTYKTPVEIPYHPSRVLMQDFTGVPAVVDLAAMRDAVLRAGGDPQQINPLIPVDLVIDHSVQVDYFGSSSAILKNVEKEYQRNQERYMLLKWAQKSFKNFNVTPPNSGICHQVNLEYLSQVIIVEERDGMRLAYPDTLVGTDSHTTMIDGIGVMGWGVGGIEAEAVMLGQPYYMSIPEVIGVKLIGALKEGITATDLVLHITEMLRKHKVVEKFVEFFGPGVKRLSLTDRATIANMTPEFGATLGFFPVDEITLEYLRNTGRTEQAEIVSVVARALGLFYTGADAPQYTQTLEFDLATVEPSLAGPARPHDRLALSKLEERFRKLVPAEQKKQVEIAFNQRKAVIGDGSVVIAAITSCTNTSNPYVLMGAGLLAKNAVERGLKVPHHVKTSLAPGSKIVAEYLKNAGLTPYLEALGFHVAGFGCTTCIGNSGPLHPEIERAIVAHDLTVVSVLSGNRNFEARIHQRIKGNFLASPLLVVAFAIAGRIDLDLTTTPLGLDPNGEPVFLKEIWPSSAEIEHLIRAQVTPALFRAGYADIFAGDAYWQALEVTASGAFVWDEQSTYIKNPPYFVDFSPEVAPLADIQNARALLLLGDMVTTDHISPAGGIPQAYPAGQYLRAHQVSMEDFNSYGARRGNHEVMMRGTFGNIRLNNALVSPIEGSRTRKFPENEEMYVYDAAMKYLAEGTPLLVLGGKEYGAGSSRDWAAKGVRLLGIKAVLAESFERIHRSNLVGMGVLPLVFRDGDSWRTLGLNGNEIFSISGVEQLSPRKMLAAVAIKPDGQRMEFEVEARLNTDIEVDYIRHGGILPYVLRKMLKSTVARNSAPRKKG